MQPYERFEKIAGGVQSIIVAVGILVGGIWALTRFSVLLEARIAEAQAAKAEAEAITATRIARQSIVLNVDLSAQQIAKTTDGKDKWVLVELTVKNTGNQDYKMDLTGDTRFYVARVKDIDSTGLVTYEKRLKLQFDFPDKTINWFLLHPGAEIDKFRTVQRISIPGLYIARFSVAAPSDPSSLGREYSAQTFFYVK